LTKSFRKSIAARADSPYWQIKMLSVSKKRSLACKVAACSPASATHLSNFFLPLLLPYTVTILTTNPTNGIGWTRNPNFLTSGANITSMGNNMNF
jgi:hypothetical protein